MRQLDNRWQRLAPDLLALAFWTSVVAVFFAPVLFQGRWMPANGGDLAGFLYPLLHYTVNSLRAGRLPLWNPYLYSGAPHLADIQTGVLYPPNLLLALLPGDVTFARLEGLSVFHIWLAGALMYVCLRGWDRPPLSRPAALLGGIAFGLSDLFVTHFGNLNLIASAAWLPLVLLGLRRGGRRGVLLGSAALALSALAGHTQPLLHILLSLALLGAYQILRLRPLLASFLATLAIPALGLGLAALTLLPAYELTGLTRRAALSYANASLYSLPPAGLIGLVAPHLHGRSPAGFWADWPRVEVGYLGVLPLVLAAVGLTRGRRALFWALLALLGLLLALGPATPVHRLFYTWVPGMSQLRAPARLILLLDFGLAGLAALGLDTLLQMTHLSFNRAIKPYVIAIVGMLVALALGVWLWASWQGLGTVGRPNAAQLATAQRAVWGGLVWLGLSGLLVVGAALGRLRGRVVAGAALVILAADLVVQGYGVDVGTSDPTANYDHPAALAFLAGDASLYRVEVRGESWGAWAPNLSLIAGLQDVSGIYNPLQVADYQLYWEGLTDRATQLYDFLNAKYLVGPKDFALPWDKFTPVFDGDPSVNIYLNTQALPRAQVVYHSRVLPDSRAQFDALRAADFDPAQTVILAHGATLDGAPTSETEVNLLDYAPERIVVAATTGADAYLVLSEVYYPGWVATVDGQPAPVERANFAFRAVPLTAGAHQVELRFAPVSWRIGQGISLLALLAWLGLAGLVYQRGRY
ncbi:MAG: YfhO family protein [Anaerolineae bacterium]|nr:YfhO family protein [Anaerolineae bacterium]